MSAGPAQSRGGGGGISISPSRRKSSAGERAPGRAARGQWELSWRGRPRPVTEQGPGRGWVKAGLRLCLYTSLRGQRRRWRWVVKSLDEEEELAGVEWTSLTVLTLSLAGGLALRCFRSHRPRKTHGRGAGVGPVLPGRSGGLGEVHKLAGGVRASSANPKAQVSFTVLSGALLEGELCPEERARFQGGRTHTRGFRKAGASALGNRAAQLPSCGRLSAVNPAGANSGIGLGHGGPRPGDGREVNPQPRTRRLTVQMADPWRG